MRPCSRAAAPAFVSEIGKLFGLKCIEVLEDPTRADLFSQAKRLRHGFDAELAAKDRFPALILPKRIGPWTIQDEQYR
jgi:hypothetical protein